MYCYNFARILLVLWLTLNKCFTDFLETEKHRDFLRFNWYRNNDSNEELIEYRMKEHVFGNTPSPAVPMYGLQKTVESADHDVKSYMYNNFTWVMELHQYRLVIKH